MNGSMFFAIRQEFRNRHIFLRNIQNSNQDLSIVFSFIDIKLGVATICIRFFLVND